MAFEVRERFICERLERYLRSGTTRLGVVSSSSLLSRLSTGLVAIRMGNVGNEMPEGVDKLVLTFMKPIAVFGDRVRQSLSTANQLVLECVGDSPVIGYSDPDSSEGFGAIVDEANRLTMENGWSVYRYVSFVLETVEKRNWEFQALFGDGPARTELVIASIVSCLNDFGRLIGMDMLLNCLHMSLTNGKRQILCVPFPDHILDHQSEDFDQLTRMIRDLPALEEIKQTKGEIVRTSAFESINLLQWISMLGTQLALCEQHTQAWAQIQQRTIKSLTFDVQNSPYSPKFKSDHVRVDVGWHGTAGENLHSIFQNGLRPMSDTRLMRNGRAFGAGVYITTHKPVAEMFAAQLGARTLWRNSVFCKGVSPDRKINCHFVLECEVARRPENDPDVVAAGEDLDSPSFENHYLLVRCPESVTLTKLHVILEGLQREEVPHNNAIVDDPPTGYSALCQQILVPIIVTILAIIVSNKFVQ